MRKSFSIVKSGLFGFFGSVSHIRKHMSKIKTETYRADIVISQKTIKLL